MREKEADSSHFHEASEEIFYKAWSKRKLVCFPRSKGYKINNWPDSKCVFSSGLIAFVTKSHNFWRNSWGLAKRFVTTLNTQHKKWIPTKCVCGWGQGSFPRQMESCESKQQFFRLYAEEEQEHVRKREINVVEN